MENAKKIFIFETWETNDHKFLPKYSSDSTNIFYGGQQFYYFFRNLHCIYERLKVACNNIIPTFEHEIGRRSEIYANYVPLLKERMDYFKNERYRQIFFRGITSFVLGEIDEKCYENLCEWLLGSRAYLLLNIGKLLNSVSLDIYYIGDKNLSAANTGTYLP